jgi:hypothetical protein
MDTSQSVARVRKVLCAGSLVFGLSALALLVVPNIFNALLGLATSSELEWAMRMIGITLVALAGNMFSVSSRGSESSVLFSGRVMLVSAFGLGVLTLLLPVQLNWFSIAYSGVGFAFSAAYAWALKTNIVFSIKH